MISDAESRWKEWSDWVVNDLVGHSLRVTICKIACWAAVYHLWQQRNAIVHSKRIKSEKQNIKVIRKDVKSRIESKSGEEELILKRIMRILCCKWDINPAILCKLPDLLSV